MPQSGGPDHPSKCPRSHERSGKFLNRFNSLHNNRTFLSKATTEIRLVIVSYIWLTTGRQSDTKIKVIDPKLRRVYSPSPPKPLSARLLFEIDIKGTYLFAAAQSEKHLVVPLREVEGRTLDELVPDIAGPFIEAIEQALQEVRPKEFSYSLTVNGIQGRYTARFIPYTTRSALVAVYPLTNGTKYVASDARR